MNKLATVLITGASSGIGATYADRYAKRGHDLVLVARNTEKLLALAQRLRTAYGVDVDIMQADLAKAADLASVEARLEDDTRIGILINNAGTSLSGTFLEQDRAAVAGLISLNAVAVARLAHAIAPRLAREGHGAIVNVASIIGLAPELGTPVYAATKAFVISLSQALAAELGKSGVYVQAVLPGATRTEIWKHAGKDADRIPGMMEVDDLVDAALVGYDRRETVTIPSLHDEASWAAYDGARVAMVPKLRESIPAPRYRASFEFGETMWPTR